MRSLLFPALLASVLATSCSSVPPAGEVPENTETAPAESNAAKPMSGVLVPADFDAVALWPEAYSGELFVLEVSEHGTTVAEGDVIARLDVKAIDEQLATAELELRSALVEHSGMLERNAIAEEAAVAALARARADLERTRKSLDGYMTYEREFTKRSDQVSASNEKHWIEDQLDELAQLEAMYTADELTDATEEIVLKRSRRDLALTRERTALNSDRRKFREEFGDKLDLESKEEALAKQELELSHLVRKQNVDRAGRSNAERRSTHGLEKKKQRVAELKRDRTLFELRAPRGGVLLHGKAQDYYAGSTQRLERGSRLTARADAFLIATPDRLNAVVNISESQLASVTDGASVSVTSVAQADLELSGTLALESFPRGGKNGDGLFRATVTLGETNGMVAGMHVKVAVDAQP